mgnify:CR=1 FL=1
MNATHPITINEIRAEVVKRNYTWTLTDPTKLLTKSELPTFFPSDTVIVTVTVTVSGDSSWAFLHHGVRHIAGGIHIREPFYKVSTHVFRRAWVIASDVSGVTLPTVRHAAIDIIGWQTLWGRSGGTYYCRAWALPYIVKIAGQNEPPDQE